VRARLPSGWRARNTLTGDGVLASSPVRWRGMASRRLLSILVVVALVAFASLAGMFGLPRSDAATAAMVQCGPIGRATSPAATVGAARWRIGGTESDQWYLFASSGGACHAALRMRAELTRMIASDGAVVRLGFGIDDWRCVASREVRQGGCTLGTGSAASHVIALAANEVGRVIAQGLADGKIEPTLLAPSRGGGAPSPTSEREYRGAEAQRCSAVSGKQWRFPSTRPAGYRSRSFPSGETGIAGGCTPSEASPAVRRMGGWWTSHARSSGLRASGWEACGRATTSGRA